jgi:hypothetical protein
MYRLARLASYCSTSSTRRFLARPSSVLLVATGDVGTSPHARSISQIIRYSLWSEDNPLSALLGESRGCRHPLQS